MPMIQTFPTASGGTGGGHIIKDKDGIAVAQENNLQFKGLNVTDNSTDQVTEVEGEGLNQDSIDDIAGANTINPAVIIGDACNYSTSEKIVGKWIDGKPLYQKTVTYTLTPSSGNRTWYDTTLLDNMNIDMCMVVDSFYITEGTILPFPQMNAVENICGWGITESNKKFRFVCGGYAYTMNFIITLQYTKTTD